MKRCPFCAERVQDAAIVCKHCSRDLPLDRAMLESRASHTDTAVSGLRFAIRSLPIVVGLLALIYLALNPGLIVQARSDISAMLGSAFKKVSPPGSGALSNFMGGPKSRQTTAARGGAVGSIPKQPSLSQTVGEPVSREIPLSSDGADGEQIVLVVQAAPIRLAPRANLTPLTVAAAGSRLRLFGGGVEGDWVHVEFTDPRWGRRVGFVERQYVRLVDAGPVR